MDFGGILNKLDNDKLGMALGSILTAKSVGDAVGGGLTGYYGQLIEGLMTEPHFPDLGHVLNALMNLNEAPVFKGGISAAIIGYLLEMVDIDPRLEKLGKILKTLGFNAAIGSGITTVLWYSGKEHSPSPSKSSGRSYSRDNIMSEGA